MASPLVVTAERGHKTIDSLLLGHLFFVFDVVNVRCSPERRSTECPSLGEKPTIDRSIYRHSSTVEDVELESDGYQVQRGVIAEGKPSEVSA